MESSWGRTLSSSLEQIKPETPRRPGSWCWKSWASFLWPWTVSPRERGACQMHRTCVPRRETKAVGKFQWFCLVSSAVPGYMRLPENMLIDFIWNAKLLLENKIYFLQMPNIFHLRVGKMFNTVLMFCLYLFSCNLIN